MASIGQIIFYSMITLSVLFAALIILILALAFSDTSEVISSNTEPIANLGENMLLSCYIHTGTGEARVGKMSVTWEKAEMTGVVYQYEDGAPVHEDQNYQFKGRTQLFPDLLPVGNASLLLRAVTKSDEGEYTCSISSSDGGGEVSIHLRTAAFSAPTFTLSNGTLAARASRWFPKPNVTWMTFDGDVLKGSTRFKENSAGIFSVVSTLQSVNSSGIYTCRIENNLVTTVSKATIEGPEVSVRTDFIYNAASFLLASTYLGVMTSSVLCICCLI